MALRGRIEHREAPEGIAGALLNFALKNPISCLSTASVLTGLSMLVAFFGSLGFVPSFEPGELAGTLAVMTLLGLIVYGLLGGMLALPGLAAANFVNGLAPADRLGAAGCIALGLLVAMAAPIFTALFVDSVPLGLALCMGVGLAGLIAGAAACAGRGMSKVAWQRSGRIATIAAGCSMLLVLVLLVVFLLLGQGELARQSVINAVQPLALVAVICAALWFVISSSPRYALALSLLGGPLALVLISLPLGAASVPVKAVMRKLELGDMDLVMLRVDGRTCADLNRAWGEGSCIADPQPPASAMRAPSHPAVAPDGTVCPVRLASKLGNEWLLEQGAWGLDAPPDSAAGDAYPMVWATSPQQAPEFRRWVLTREASRGYQVLPAWLQLPDKVFKADGQARGRLIELSLCERADLPRPRSRR